MKCSYCFFSSSASSLFNSQLCVFESFFHIIRTFAHQNRSIIVNINVSTTTNTLFFFTVATLRHLNDGYQDVFLSLLWVNINENEGKRRRLNVWSIYYEEREKQSTDYEALEDEESKKILQKLWWQALIFGFKHINLCLCINNHKKHMMFPGRFVLVLGSFVIIEPKGILTITHFTSSYNHLYFPVAIHTRCNHLFANLCRVVLSTVSHRQTKRKLRGKQKEERMEKIKIYSANQINKRTKIKCEI